MSEGLTRERADIDRYWLVAEDAALARLRAGARAAAGRERQVTETAAALVGRVRARRRDEGGLQAFLRHYDLSSQEGTVLMCLAEALLRIPDPATVDALIAERVGGADWRRHLGLSESLFVNASTWALMLSGRVLEAGQGGIGDPAALLGRVLARLEEPVLRGALRAAMSVMADGFVLGRDIGQALARAAAPAFAGARFSFDMLGEAALTAADARRYLAAYRHAIRRAGADAPSHADAEVSVKLSALWPRFEFAHETRALAAVGDALMTLALDARAAGVSLTVDAEEADRLALTLAVFERVRGDARLAGWDGLGLAVQAYQKRAPAVLAWLQALAAAHGVRVPVRLVKGAYWDSEIKRAQQQGLADYPVFTRKCHTDVSYLACARYLLEEGASLVPRFATHNAHTVAWILAHAGDRAFEFQRLHGMGEALYESLAEVTGAPVPCRVYAPVGAHEDLLPYLVRRLLENGANTSFVNRISDAALPIDVLVADPLASAAAPADPGVVRPPDLFRPARVAARGLNFASAADRRPLMQAIERLRAEPPRATALVDGVPVPGAARAVRNPARPAERVGSVADATPELAGRALDIAAGAARAWADTAVAERAAILERAADALEAHAAELTALTVLEAGKTLADGHDDVREAIDFLRYYADEARRLFAHPRDLPGPTGESNQLRWRARGVFVCISPWNFPVAIFTGQVAAALAAGNVVIAKPAEQTSLTAARVTALLHAAGVPPAVLGLLPGDGPQLGAGLLDDPRVAGVAFTGSTATAQAINRRLAARDAPLAVLIAETGGVNAMIVDSSALPEQVVRDAVRSAFNSAGQRCSALRVLCLQEDCAERVLSLLLGHLEYWTTGAPERLDSDMGPVIDGRARDAIEDYIARCAAAGRLLLRGHATGQGEGLFVPPAVIRIDHLGELEGEIFGPVLHVLRYRASALPGLLDDLEALGYGLTLGVHSRIERRAADIARRFGAGNVYVNRDMIGAVVGVQPFGGRGLSGTGPKAGGPHYLLRFATEQTVTVNTAAIGGNASLMQQPRPAPGEEDRTS